MHPVRRRPRVAATGRVTILLHTAQRDFLERSPETPLALAHALHRAPVRDGKLSVRVTRPELEALIRAAAAQPIPGRREARALDALLRYLEAAEDRFDVDTPADADDAGDAEDALDANASVENAVDATDVIAPADAAEDAATPRTAESR